ncbi:MAG: RNA methyltransferase [marine benthic group bacterium]|jgi:TrmH family RNA methyltransferase|nr:RNA methyltransferase [Gemmatimonadota bacterium]MCL7938170.1 RNA methyltransferase [Gemmatimonadota bacterium]MCL7966518.1 RNA methyltransferase [Gemmatimonadota bacterium]MCL7976232.1 RNA methyltransferase [Gemmatimonadota bacterium]
MISRTLHKRLAALSRRKERVRAGLFLAEGWRVVGELVDADVEVKHCLYTDPAGSEPAVREILVRLEDRQVPCERVSARDLAEISDTVTPQGILAVAVIPRVDPEVVGSRLLMVDGVQDPGNLGTLIRTAEALGAGGVIVLPGTVDPWSPKVVRAAAGASFRVPLVEMDSGEAIHFVGGRGIPIWASAADGVALQRGDPCPDRVALAVGNEGAGVSREIRDAAERIVAIEQAGGAESLNVAIAAAILLDRILGGAGAGSD